LPTDLSVQLPLCKSKNWAVSGRAGSKLDQNW
jgi:hypothetical protein